LEFSGDFGRIATGALSRFILTRHSPLETVAHLQREKTVVFDGRVFAADAPIDLTGL
jgi:hypothetical protein